MKKHYYNYSVCKRKEDLRKSERIKEKNVTENISNLDFFSWKKFLLLELFRCLFLVSPVFLYHD